MEIRDAKRDDAKQLAQLWQALRVEEDENMLFERYPRVTAMQWLQGLLPFFSGGGRILVADAGDGQLTGYIKYIIDSREMEEESLVVQVQEMFTRKEVRKTLVGARLVKGAEIDIREFNMEQGDGPKVTRIEILTRPTDGQLERWMKKGYQPYIVALQKEFA